MTMSDRDVVPAQGKKWTREAIADRRRQVFEFVLLRGINECAIAEQIGVSRRTIVQDVKELRETVRREVKELDVLADIGEQKKRYEKISEWALMEASTTKLPGSKAVLLGQALRAMELKQRLLIDTGFYPNAALKVNASLTVSGGLDIRRMSTAELREMRDRLAVRLGGILKPGPS